MRLITDHIEPYRVKRGPLATNAEFGMNGAFIIPHETIETAAFMVIVSDGEGWEHVSVRVVDTQIEGQDRICTWDEMCFIKDLFWTDEEEAFQFHPPKSQYVNNHPHVLHLWRPTTQKLPLPPSSMVGILTK